MRDLEGLKRRLGSKPRRRSSKEPLNFEASPLNPVPVPQLATLPETDVWEFLKYTDPIDGPDMLAFQVAQLTVGMGELKRQIDELKEGQLK